MELFYSSACLFVKTNVLQPPIGHELPANSRTLLGQIKAIETRAVNQHIVKPTCPIQPPRTWAKLFSHFFSFYLNLSPTVKKWYIQNLLQS